MYDFIIENPFLILGIVGGLVAFLLTLTKTVMESQKKKFILILSIIGFVILVIQQLIEYNNARNKAIVEEYQKKIIEEIRFRVHQTQISVEAISTRIEDVSFDVLGTEMITVNRELGESEFEEAMAFAKGSPDMWEKYANWLSFSKGKNINTSISLTLNAGNHYNLGLLIAYILTSDKTKNDIISVIDNHNLWDDFPTIEFINKYGLNEIDLKWILFFDQSPYNLVAYADVNSFVKELIIYQKSGRAEIIERLLNQSTRELFDKLTHEFHSIKTIVLHDSDPYKIVSTMINNQISQVAVVKDNKNYIVYLENVIKLAAESS